MEPKLLQSRASAAVSELKASYRDLASLKGFSFATARNCAHYVVEHVQKLGEMFGLEGAEKKELAVEIVMQLVPIPAWLPDFMARAIVGWAIESALKAYKQIRGIK